MRSVISHAERDRRWKAIDEALDREGLDAIVVVSSAYNGGGHKGALRYVSDHHLRGFQGYAVVPRGGEPMVIMPFGNAGSDRSDWVDDYRFARNMPACLVEVLTQLPCRERVGIVGRNLSLRVDEYLYLAESLGETELVEATALLDSVRSVKSAEEIRGLEEASAITDRCLERMLEVARPGVTHRQLFAEMYKACAELGGEDPIFLAMDGHARKGQAKTGWSRQSDMILAPSDLLTFSFELIGPSGYWVEMCRLVVFAPPSEDKLAIHAAIAAAMEAARDALRPGATAEDVQRAILGEAAKADTRLAWWSGHGIGQDVMEAPAIGREVMQDVSSASSLGVAESMAFAIHPLLVPNQDGVAGYMADTYVVGGSQTHRLSKFPLDLIELV